VALFEEGDVFFTIFSWAFEVITWGWIAEILLAIVLIICFLFLALILKEFKVIKFIFKDKFYFLKAFLYYYLMEKFNFIRHYWSLVKFNVADWSPYFVIIMSVAVILVGFFIFFGMRLLLEMGQSRGGALGA